MTSSILTDRDSRSAGSLDRAEPPAGDGLDALEELSC